MWAYLLKLITVNYLSLIREVVIVKLIQNLNSVQVISKTGHTRMRAMGLFFCPICKKAVTRNKDNGKRVDSCGNKECQKSKSYRHGYVGTSIYTAWANMKARCDNPKNTAYKYYGAKGITYPASWKTFKGFAKDMLLSWEKGLTIDRKNHNNNYSKDNCQWIPMNDNRIKDQIKTIAKLTSNGSILAVYASAADAVRSGECQQSTSITRVARGERKAFKGFQWKYLN